jgi:hypothetical protein
MPVFNIDILQETSGEFEVFCSCGSGLCGQASVRYSRIRGEPQVVVEPCQECLGKAKDAGADEGYDQGYNDRKEEETE